MKMMIKEGWDRSGRVGTRLGPDITVGTMNWTPILWDDEEDPDWHKSVGLAPEGDRLVKFFRFDGCLLRSLYIPSSTNMLPQFLTVDGDIFELRAFHEKKRWFSYRQIAITPFEDVQWNNS